jgi:hypothetical protein
LDQYMIHGYNITAVEYMGRGHEHFYDEILRIFDWMGRFKRDFFPREFEVKSLRPWDNFFWWVEVSEPPDALVLLPHQWPARGKRAMQIDAKVTATNGIHISCGAGKVTVWLAPEFIDLNRPISVNVRGMKLRGGADPIAPDIAILLEDVRTRGDRLHPFWARIDMPSGRVNLAATKGRQRGR